MHSRYSLNVHSDYHFYSTANLKKCALLWEHYRKEIAKPVKKNRVSCTLSPVPPGMEQRGVGGSTHVSSPGKWLWHNVCIAQSHFSMGVDAWTPLYSRNDTSKKTKLSFVFTHGHALPYRLQSRQPLSPVLCFHKTVLWECSVNGIKCYLTFWGWLISHSAFEIHPCCISHSRLLIAE